MVTEAATNLLKHAAAAARSSAARSGTATAGGWRSWRWTAGRGWRTSAAACATATRRPAAPGTGLGAIRAPRPTLRRLLRAPGGTAALAGAALVRRRAATTRRPSLRDRRRQPADGRRGGCGDAWASRATPDGAVILVVDGLGHGPAGRRGGPGGRRALPEARRRRPGRDRSSACTRRCARPGAPRWRSPGRSERGERPVRRASATSRARPRRRAPAASMVSHNGTSATRSARSRSSPIPGRRARCWSCTPTAWPPTGASTATRAGRRAPGLIAGVLYRDFRAGPRRRDRASWRERRGDS